MVGISVIRKWNLVGVGMALLLSSCGGRERYYTKYGVNHTTYRIKYEYTRPLDDEIETEFRKYYHSINPFDSLSILSRVNRNEPVEVDSLFICIFRTAQEVSRQTGGMFDVTCAPLINLWGFGFEKYGEVSPRMVDSMRTFVGYQKVRLEGRTVVKDNPRVLLNFSALGDGSICDVIAGLFDGKGIDNYMIDVGGEVIVKGMNPEGRSWCIGIVKPVDDAVGMNNGSLQEIVRLSGRKALATSGDYRNYYIKNGKKVAHTINPLTGYPAAQDILSATVIADHCVIADAYATAFMALGSQKARQLAREHPELDYYIIYADSTGNYCADFSEGMSKYLFR